VLRWARETSALDIDTAAARIGVTAERIAMWEDGNLAPTIGQIRAMADVYARPLAALFMSEPLTDEVKRDLPDFRGQEARGQVASRSLQKAIMRAHRQRDALRDVALDLELPDDDVAARFKFDRRLDGAVLGQQLRTALAIDSVSQSTLLQPELLLRELVRRAEELNVTVIQVQRVELAEMRGFSLGDGTCPVVALNGADWPRGKIYTLLHELSHVGFRSNGLCDLHAEQDAQMERRCDAVAAAALMPARAFLSVLDSVSQPTLSPELTRAVGNQFGASGESALIRMIELGRATWADYWRLKPEFDAAYSSFKAGEKQRNLGRDSPIYYQVKRRDLGRRFISQMVTAYQEDVLSSRDLAQLLETPFDKVPKLVGAAGEVA
jgi:Zn-dependent peptidase ImmA (M78 family)/transcriptional regulator with XRE-family HTH domain